MLRHNGKGQLGIALTIFLLGFAGIGVAATRNRGDTSQTGRHPKTLIEQVRHELVMLPYLGVFDNLAFSIEESDTVVLSGQVVRPVLKSEAEAAAKRIEGISKVVNNIEVLPVSPYDDAIRLRAYRAIFSRPGFEKYADQAVKPIRIIVKNGHVTLDGFVGSQMDKTLANIAARSVPGVFSVTDNLQIG